MAKKAKANPTATFTGRCMKCKDTRTVTGEVTTNSNGGKMAKGACPECGTTVCKFLKRDWEPDDSVVF